MERIEPEVGTWDTAAMSRGEPGFPHVFSWRGTRYEVEALVRTWREVSSGDTPGVDQYVRRHGFEVRTKSGEVIRLIGERDGRRRGGRWWIRAIQDPHDEQP